MWSSPSVYFLPLTSRSEQVCLASSDLLRTHLALAGTRCHYYYCDAGRSATPLADLPRHRIEDLVGCGVRDVRLYQTALSAPSAVEPDHMIAQSFDRLEYLGDAVVQVVFGSYIYQR